VCKQIFAAVIWSDEAKAFGIIEPLNSTSCHKRTFKYNQITRAIKSKKLLAPSSACSLLINKYTVPADVCIVGGIIFEVKSF
jgi:hypothetical protein